VLSDSDRERYQRHLQLPAFGETGQAALKKARVCVVGLGGLGCPATLYLAAAGVGQLTLVDGDSVSLSNLQRQVLFTESDLGDNKAEAAAAQLAARNSTIKVSAEARHLDAGSALQLFKTADIVLDCTDNFHTRYLINDLCQHLGKPWIYASVLGFSGQFALFRPGGGCFRCLFPQLGEVPDCNQAGVLGAVPGILGSQQALAAIKYLAGLTKNDPSRLYSFEGLDLSLRSFSLSTAPGCPLCSGRETYRDRLNDYLPQESKLMIEYTVAAADFLRYVEEQNPLLVDVRPAEEHRAGNLGGINIPMDNLTTDLDRHNEDGRPVLLYCLIGKRSAMAASVLLEQGFENILSLEGGLQGQSS